MTTPIIIETELGQVLTQINQKLDNLQEGQNATRMAIESLKGEIKTLDEKLTGKINSLDEKLTGKINSLDVEVKGISKRLENQEFLSRGVLIGLIVAIAGGAAKLFGFFGNP